MVNRYVSGGCVSLVSSSGTILEAHLSPGAVPDNTFLSGDSEPVVMDETGGLYTTRENGIEGYFVKWKKIAQDKPGIKPIPTRKESLKSW